MRWQIFIPAIMSVLLASSAAVADPPEGKKKPKHEDLIEMGKGLLNDDEPESPPAKEPAPSSPSPPPQQDPPPLPPAPSPEPTPLPLPRAPAELPAPTAPVPPTIGAAQKTAAPVMPIAPAAAGKTLPSAPAAAPLAQLLAPGALADAATPTASSPDLLLPPMAQAEVILPVAPSVAEVTAPPTETGLVIMTPAQRIETGKNYPMVATAQSPLARVGLNPRLVPAIATLLTLGAMSVWPFLMKTLLGLLKKLAAALLKNRAKKSQKLERDKIEWELFGFRIRPAELVALIIAAATYGLAVCYSLKGWKLDSRFVLYEELLVIAIYYARSTVRFVYERWTGLTTRYTFWPGGGILCLASAYFGNTLGTVGFELDAAKGKEDAARLVKIKVWMLLLALAMAIGFFAANLFHPDKILQSGRVITSGMALGEVMPMSPMPGLKIFRWRRSVWATLFVLVVPTFFLINFFL